MPKEHQKTLYDKWKIDSEEPGGSFAFKEAEDTGERADLEGFSEEELRRILGEKEYQKYKGNHTDEIEEVQA